MRAGLVPFTKQSRAHSLALGFFKSQLDFDEIFFPYFYEPSPFWSRAPFSRTPRNTNSGALVSIVAGLPGAYVSRHPTNAFAGCGERVVGALQEHGEDALCFSPIRELAERFDFSILLVGCLTESPGLSTVNVAQRMRWLGQRNLIRYLLRWDTEGESVIRSRLALESPILGKSSFSIKTGIGNFALSGLIWVKGHMGLQEKIEVKESI